MKSNRELEFEYMNKAGLLMAYPELEAGFQEREFSIGDVGVSTRVMNSWEKRGLLTPNKAGQHRRFNIEEYVWLKMILKIKKFNIKLPIMKELGRYLMRPQNFNELAGGAEVKEQLLKILGFGDNESDGSEYEDILNKLLGNDLIKNALSGLNITYLGLLIRDAILLKNHLSILINEKGEATLFKESMSEEFLSNPDFVEFIHGTYVSISLTEILKEFILDHTVVAHSKLALITDEEFKLLELIRKEKAKSVKIRYDQEGNMNYVDITTSKTTPKVNEVVEVMLTGQYGDIQVKLQGGKIQHFENTRKIKL